MSLIADLVERGRSLLARRRQDEDLDEELRYHLERETEANLAAGLGPVEARRRARLKLGGVDQVKERTREARGVLWIENVVRDVRVAIRSLLRTPGFALAVVLTLGGGIGATTAVFSTVDHLLLRPLPYMEAERVVTVTQVDLRSGERGNVAPGNFLSWADRSTSFEALGIAEQWSSDFVPGDGPPEELPVWRVDRGFLPALGAQVILGRGFTDEEFEGTAHSDAALGIFRDHTGTGRSVLISERFWRSRFGADSTIVGRTIRLDGADKTVVGVLSSTVEYPQARPIWAPKLFTALEPFERSNGSMSVVGRLRAGVTLAQAQAEMDRVAAGLAEEFPAANSGVGIVLEPLRQTVIGRVESALWILLGAVSFLLLVAAANVAGMMLARGSSRGQELAVRVALGAGRRRIAGQLLTECLVLATAGGLLGVGLASLALDLLAGMGPADLPGLDSVTIDLRVLGFAAGITIFTALLSGSMPARRAMGASGRTTLSSESRSATAAADGMRLRNGLVVGQVAIALALLIGAGLLGRSFDALLRSDLGFDPENRATVQAFLWDRNPSPLSRVQRAEEIAREMTTVPGVEAVAIASSVPFHPYGTFVPIPVEASGGPPLAEGQQPQARQNIVSPEYFQVLSIPLVSGRSFDDSDRGNSRPVAIINESMAAAFFAGEDPVGRRLTATSQYSGLSGEREIVGVVADVHNDAVDAEPTPEIFVPFAQNGFGGTIFVARTATDASAALPSLQEAIWAVDPDQSVYLTATMDDLVGETLGPRRFSLVLLTVLALIGIVLATTGIYGTISFSISRRTREFGIRMAIGASREQVLSMVLRQGLRVGITGVLCGVLLALLLTRSLRHLLFGIERTDVWTYLAFSMLMLGVSVLASWVPAWRGSRLDPNRTLRDA